MNENLQTVFKEPASAVISRKFLDYTRKMCPRYGFDFDVLLDSARSNPNCHAAYNAIVQAAMEENLPKIFKQLEKHNISSLKLMEDNVTNIGNALDAIYTFTNNLRFVYSCGCSSLVDFFSTDLPQKVADYDFMNCFDEIEDMILDIKLKEGYANIMVRLSKADYTINCKKGHDLPLYNLVYLTYMNDKSVVLGQFSVIRDVFPNLMLNPRTTTLECALGAKCTRCVKSNVSMIDFTGHVAEEEFCYMTEKKMLEYACEMSILGPYKVLKIMAYIWDVYKNRHTLERKNSRMREIYHAHEVSTIVSTKNEQKILPLHNYYRYEREHKEWQGGHHQAPVEHHRRAHSRRIYNKDGTLKKVVPVASSIVNKGNSKTFYEVKSPQNKP